METIPSSLYPKLLDLINETYSDGMDSIESAQVDEDGTIEAIAIDEGTKYACRYQDGAIEIKHLSDGASSKTGSFATGKARNCKAGISCGNSCISKTKTCRKKGTSGQAEKAKEITALVHQPGKGSPKDVPAKAKATGKDRKPKEPKPATKKTKDESNDTKSESTPKSDPTIKRSQKEVTRAIQEAATAPGKRTSRSRIEALDSKKAGDYTKMSATDLTTVLLDTSNQHRDTLLGVSRGSNAKDFLRVVSKKIHPDINKDPRAAAAFNALKSMYENLSK